MYWNSPTHAHFQCVCPEPPRHCFFSTYFQRDDLRTKNPLDKSHTSCSRGWLFLFPHCQQIFCLCSDVLLEMTANAPGEYSKRCYPHTSSWSQCDRVGQEDIDSKVIESRSSLGDSGLFICSQPNPPHKVVVRVNGRNIMSNILSFLHRGM